jgi:hypothetical protein
MRLLFAVLINKKLGWMTCHHPEKPANLKLPVTAACEWFRFESH